MTLTTRTALSTLLLAALTAGTARAVPAYPDSISVLQPDGTRVSLCLRGDEYLHWAVSPDGFTLLQDEAGFWTFATHDNDGRLAPSSLRYSNSSEPARLQGIAPGLTFCPEQLAEKYQRAALPQVWKQADHGSLPQRAADKSLQLEESFPTTGKHKLLVLLVNFSDTETSYTQEEISEMMNGVAYGGNGSFRDYYLAESYGQLDIDVTVSRWVQLPYSKSLYGTDGAIYIIGDALEALDEEIDLTEFDNDHDGILDGLAVIHQGAGQETTGSSSDIWSHSSTITGMAFDGIQVRRYTIEPEILGTTGELSPIGVICHEFGHNLGAPDFYDTDYSVSGGEYCGTGKWDLLGSGAWNGNYGDCPAPINAWQKIQMGWLSPTLLDTSQRIEAMPSIATSPVAYRMNTTVPGEYFILENRQQADNAFHGATPGSGLIVYHVDEGIIRDNIYWNTLNITYPQGIYTVCADATEDAGQRVSSYGDINVASALFGGEGDHHAFSDATTPSSRSRSGRYSYKSLSNIVTDKEGRISFDFTQNAVPDSPTGLTAKTIGKAVSLTWDAPAADHEGFGVPARYNIYRQDEWIAHTTECSFVDEEPDDGATLVYQVDAEYDSGLVSPYVETAIRLPKNIIATTQAVVAEGDDAPEVKLTWTLPTTLTRMSEVDLYESATYNCESIEYVHRFTADDLAAYRGYKIRRVGFLSFSGPQEVSITLRVWQAEADGSSPTILSERTIKEFGKYMWNDILLTKAVEIQDQPQLWIGIQAKTLKGVAEIANDHSGEGMGMGNYLRLNDGEWHADDKTSGNFALRFTLAAPSAPDAACSIFADDELTDPTLDLLFPIGFGIYRDGELLGYTGNTCFIDRMPVGAQPTYGITNVYKGYNESEPTLVKVSLQTNGLTTASTTDVADCIRPYAGGISLQTDGAWAIYDAGGRLMNKGGGTSGSKIPLPDGFYIVRTPHSQTKVLLTR